MRKKIEELIEVLYSRASWEGTQVERYRRKDEMSGGTTFLAQRFYHEGNAESYGRIADKLKAILEDHPARKYPCIKLPSA
jgi:hypothetical protein